MSVELSRADQIRQSYCEGYSTREIRLRYGNCISRAAIYKDIAGVERPPEVVTLREIFRESRWGFEDTYSIFEAVSYGMQAEDLVKQFGVSTNTARIKLHQLIDSQLVPPQETKPTRSGLRRNPDYIPLRNFVQMHTGRRFRDLSQVCSGLQKYGFHIDIFPGGLNMRHYFVRIDQDEEFKGLTKEHLEILTPRKWADKPKSNNLV